ncbi:zinc finger protein 345-like isoform X1 [Mya arenaria]|uniref:zinc finger protein 345-like isoform X1 n=2 Tax=Mya arenaria TaxID=6604 RepID=UPI0022E53D05|nr:zinc finger protein 345-like isoform X1 [Mya arenaria]
MFLRYLEVVKKMEFEGEDFTCSLCERSYDSKEALLRHEKLHFRERSFECHICNKTFYTEGYLKDHVQRHSGIKKYQCDLCDKSFANPGYLKVHKQWHNNERNRECFVCKKRFLHATSYQLHMRTHTNERPVACDICGKMWKSASDKNRHKKTVHSDERPYPCKMCDKAFKTSAGLTSHIEVHKDVKRTAKCDLCGKTVRLYGLSQHKKDHFAEKVFACTLCPKKFKSKHQLNMHQPTHTGEQKYECDICGMAFSFNANRNRHRKTHEENRCYRCDVCGHGFRNKSTLRTHMWIHTREVKKFKCHLCIASFPVQHHLNVHMRLHTPSHKYACELCGVRYTNKTALMTHNLMHEAENVSGNKKRKKLAYNELRRLSKDDESETYFSKRRKRKTKAKLNLNRNRKKTYLKFENDEHEDGNRKIEPSSKQKIFHKCFLCKKRYFGLPNYKIHLQFHTQNEIVKCVICSKICRTKEALKGHMEIHGTWKPLICPFCDHRFKTYASIEKHMNSHTNEKKFKCDYCLKEFKYLAGIRKHAYRHVAEYTFQCGVCGARFSNKQGLLRHRSNHANLARAVKAEMQVEDVVSFEKDFTDKDDSTSLRTQTMFQQDEMKADVPDLDSLLENCIVNQDSEASMDKDCETLDETNKLTDIADVNLQNLSNDQDKKIALSTDDSDSSSYDITSKGMNGDEWNMGDSEMFINTADLDNLDEILVKNSLKDTVDEQSILQSQDRNAIVENMPNPMIAETNRNSGSFMIDTESELDKQENARELNGIDLECHKTGQNLYIVKAELDED